MTRRETKAIAAELRRARSRGEELAADHELPRSVSAALRRAEAARHLQAQGRHLAVGHAVSAAELPAGSAAADVRLGLSAGVHERRRGQPGRRIAEPLPDGRRRVAPAAPDAGLRDLRRPDDADRRPGRNGQRHLRRSARRQRPGGGRLRRRRRLRRSRRASASAATATAAS